MNVREQRWRVVQTLHRQWRAGLATGRSFRYALIDQTPYALKLHGSNDGADVDGFVERRADA